MSALRVRPETRARCAKSATSGAETEETGRQVAEDYLRARLALHGTARAETFREAVFLSSPDMLANLESEYTRREVPLVPNAKGRRWERKALSYLQRVCTKNETASFFGPKNYGCFAIQDRPPQFVVAPSIEHDKCITAKDAYYAYWVGCALRDEICKEAQIQMHLKPRLNPICSLDGTRLHFHVIDRAVVVREDDARLLRVVDGSRSVAELSEAMGLQPAETLARVKRLVSAKALLFDLPIPSTCEQPLSFLLKALQQLGASGDRVEYWMELLRDLEATRRRFIEARLEDRRPLLGHAEKRFQEATGVDPRRGSGQIYADRFVIYEECRGVVDTLEMSRRTRDRVTRQIQDALELSGYHGYLVWHRHQRVGRELFARLSPTGAPVSFGRFLKVAKEEWSSGGNGGAGAAVDDDLARFSERTGRALDEVTAGREEIEVEIASERLVSSGAPRPVYGLLDLMIAARSFEAVEEGDYRLVLAQIHPHLLVWSWLTSAFPDRARWEARHDEHLRRLEVFEALADIRVARRNKAFYCFPGKQVEYLTPVDGDRSQVIPLADLEVAEEQADGCDARLRLRRKSTGEWIWLYLALADFMDYLPFSIFALPSLRKVQFGRGMHTPRIVVGKLVYQRRRWRIGGDRLSLCARKPSDISEVCRRIWRLQEELGMPEHVFVRGVEERKPIYIDFANPLLIELLAHRAGQWNELVFEEMLPGPEDLWLRQGRASYCCELRAGALFYPRGVGSTSDGLADSRG